MTELFKAVVESIFFKLAQVAWGSLRDDCIEHLAEEENDRIENGRIEMIEMVERDERVKGWEGWEGWDGWKGWEGERVVIAPTVFACSANWLEQARFILVMVKMTMIMVMMIIVIMVDGGDDDDNDYDDFNDNLLRCSSFASQ